MSERFPSPKQETAKDADNDALREAYLQEATEQQEESQEDPDTAALREAYNQDETKAYEEEAAAVDESQPKELSLEEQFNLPAIRDEDRNVELPEGYSGTPSSETEDADTAALREAYNQDETKALEKAAQDQATYGSGRRINAYARKPEAAASGSTVETAAPRPDHSRTYTVGPSVLRGETQTMTPLETSGEGMNNDMIKNLLAQNKELSRAVQELTARLNKLTSSGPIEQAPVSTIDHRRNDASSPSGPELPEYQRAHLAEMDLFAKVEQEWIDRKANAEARKAERKRIRRLERQAKKAERKESRSEWRILAAKRVWAIGKAALGKLSGKPSGWTTGKNAATAAKINETGNTK